MSLNQLKKHINLKGDNSNVSKKKIKAYLLLNFISFNSFSKNELRKIKRRNFKIKIKKERKIIIRI
jgi:hypothetical protein